MTTTVNQPALERLRQTQRDQLQSLLAEQPPPLVGDEEIEAHFANMPERYWGHVNEEDVRWHLETLHAFFASLTGRNSQAVAPVVRWRHFPDGGFTEVVIGTWDRLGLCAKVACSFAEVGLNIFHADIYTRDDDVVLDIFRVYDGENSHIRDEARLVDVARRLAKSLSEQVGAVLPPLN